MKKICLGLILFGLSSCRDPDFGEVLDQLRGNRYVQSIQVGNHVVTVRYLPHSLQVMGRAQVDSAIPLTAALCDSLKSTATASQGVSFLLTLAPRDTTAVKGLANDVVYGDHSGYATHQEATQAFLFGLKEKIWMEAGGKKIPLANYTMENNWGMAPDRSFFLVFPLPSGKKPGEKFSFELVLGDMVPGMTRKKMTWTLPLGKYDDII
jgi:hypothetical protein